MIYRYKPPFVYLNILIYSRLKKKERRQLEEANLNLNVTSYALRIYYA